MVGASRRGQPVLLALCLALAGCPASSYLKYRVAPDYPRDRDQTHALAGLSQPAKVYLDSYGVPHIEAGNEPDLFRALGFVHGRSRFFQMDFMRRLAGGKLSELFGEQPFLGGRTTVDYDVTLRAWGFAEEAADGLADLAPETRALFEAYVSGVNAGLKDRTPLEYRLLRVEPEPWTLADTLAVGVFNRWTISHNWGQETARLLLALHVGAERAERLYPSEPWPGSASLPGDAEARALPPAVAPELAPLFPARPYAGQAGASEPTAANVAPQPLLSLHEGASNAWVVGAARSASGAPLLANDPHLSHLAPSLLVQHHLKCPTLEAIGAGVPGMPLLTMGHNKKVAWGMSSAVADVQDLFVEQVHPADPSRVRGPAGDEPLATEELLIGVRQRREVELRRVPLRRTPRGPVLNDMLPGLLPPWAPLVSLKRVRGHSAATATAMLDAMRAGTVQELRAALSAAQTGNMWTVADTPRGVGQLASGRLPQRLKHRGTFPAPAWVPGYAWSGLRQPETMPGALAGADAMYAHANNLVVDPRRRVDPFHLDSAPSYRHERAMALLRAKPKHDPSSFAAMQRDLYSGRAAKLVPALLADLDAADASLEPAERAARELLRTWRFDTGAGSSAASVFFVTYREAATAALEDEVDSAALSFLLSQRYSFVAFDRWLADPEHPVWDHHGTAATERRADVVVPAFKWAVVWLRQRFGDDVAGWRWGTLHELRIGHVFGSKRLLAGLCNMPEDEGVGGPDTLWKSHFDMGNEDKPFRTVAGPVFRMIVDMANPERAQWVLDTGASGWPGSPHYHDQHQLWKQGSYAPMVSDWARLRKEAVAIITLQ